MQPTHLFAALLSLTQVAAQTTDVTGAPIEYPPDIGTRSGSVVTVALEIAEYTYTGPGVVQQTRAFNGIIPGPTIRVQPGTPYTTAHTDNPHTTAHTPCC